MSRVCESIASATWPGGCLASFTRPQLEAEPHTHILDSVAVLPALL